MFCHGGAWLCVEHGAVYYVVSPCLLWCPSLPGGSLLLCAIYPVPLSTIVNLITSHSVWGHVRGTRNMLLTVAIVYC
jgi:hypothetical protein